MDKQLEKLSVHLTNVQCNSYLNVVLYEFLVLGTLASRYECSCQTDCFTVRYCPEFSLCLPDRKLKRRKHESSCSIAYSRTNCIIWNVSFQDC